MQGLAYTRLTSDLTRADALRRQKHNPCAPGVLLKAVSVRRNRIKTSTIRGIKFDDESCTQSTDSHSRVPMGIRKGILLSDFIH
jgi:hypothetical protein